MKLGFIDKCFKNPPNIEFHENISSGSRVVPCPQSLFSWAIILGVNEGLTTLLTTNCFSWFFSSL